MGSKGRMPPPHLRRPLPGPGGMIHSDPFGPGVRPPPGHFPFDMLPPPEVLEQKLAQQHVEMQRLATENQRLAATHASLRQELAATQHESQRLQAHISAMKNDKEQQMRGLLDKIAKMEAESQASEPVKMELQQARSDAQSLIVGRQELISKVQQLTQDLQRSHGDVQQIPALMSELDGLRQEYQHCRATYDYEKKLYNDHLESLQVMEKNYVSMAREVEKLRAELANASNLERRSGGSYGGATGYTEKDAAAQYPVGQQNAYEDGYGASQGRVPPPSGGGVGAAAAYGGGPTGSAPTRAGYDAAPRGPGSGFDAGPRGPGAGYDAVPRGPSSGYDAAPRGPSYDASRGPSYDAPRGPSYDAQRGSSYDAQRGSGYDVQRGAAYDAPRVATGPGPQASVAPGSTMTPTRAGAGGGYEVPPRAGNPVHR